MCLFSNEITLLDSKNIIMKTIDVNGRKLEYEIFYDVCEYGEAYQTVFYEGTISKNRKK